jgi:hypothetical protein
MAMWCDVGATPGGLPGRLKELQAAVQRRNRQPLSLQAQPAVTGAVGVPKLNAIAARETGSKGK